MMSSSDFKIQNFKFENFKIMVYARVEENMIESNEAIAVFILLF